MTDESEGLAVLHGFDPETGKVTTDVFCERRSGSPHHEAQAMRDAVKDDFPGWIWAIGQNRRSHYLMYVRNMESMGFGDDVKSYEEWSTS